jgi:hypothetical protein
MGSRTRLGGALVGALATLTLSASICSTSALATVSPALPPSPSTSGLSATPALSASSYTTTDSCGKPASGKAGCLSVRAVPSSIPSSALQANASAQAQALGKGTTPAVSVTSPVPGSYFPAELDSAYDLPATTDAASTQTIAIVDAYNDPDIASDLAVYSAAAGKPACTVASGCLTILNEQGKASPLPTGEGGWATEESLDVEMSHGLCPQCKIVLVEASSESFSDIIAAVNEAASLHPTEISNSYGGEEDGSLTSIASAYDHPGIAITASAGDYGYEDWGAFGQIGGGGVPNFPASSPDVVAVGGTTLADDSGTWSSTVWSSEDEFDGTGGGCSTLFTAPPWQQDQPDWDATDCGTSRLVSDVSADADPYTGVAVYDSYPDGQGDPTGWTVLGGTSVASPIVSAEFALAGGAQGVSYPAQTLYAHVGTSALYDVTEGSNDPFAEYCSAPALACTAGPGYDGPSGVGSPVGLGAFTPASGSGGSGGGSGETAPVSTSVPAISGHTVVGKALTASPGTWTGSPTPTLSYQWEDCDVSGTGCSDVASGGTSSSYTLTEADAGSTIRVVVKGTNGAGSASATSAPTEVVTAPHSGGGGGSGSGPTNSGLPTVTDITNPSGPQVGDLVFGSLGSWSSPSSFITGYSDQWYDCTAQGTGCVAINGATNLLYTPTTSDRGYALEIAVTASNSSGATTAFSLPTKIVGGSGPTPGGPTNASAPVVTDQSSDSYEVGDSLTTTPGTWSASGAITYAYQWQDCDAIGGECADIRAATGPTYTLTSGDAYKTVRVVVTATDSGGSTPADSAVTPLIGPGSAAVEVTPPAVTDASDPGAYTVGDILTATTGSWEDASPATIILLWQRCDASGEGCQAIATAPSSSYVLTQADVGSTIEVQVTVVTLAGATEASSEPTGVVTVPGTPPGGGSGPGEGSGESGEGEGSGEEGLEAEEATKGKGHGKHATTGLGSSVTPGASSVIGGLASLIGTGTTTTAHAQVGSSSCTAALDRTQSSLAKGLVAFALRCSGTTSFKGQATIKAGSTTLHENVSGRSKGTGWSLYLVRVSPDQGKALAKHGGSVSLKLTLAGAHRHTKGLSLGSRLVA